MAAPSPELQAALQGLRHCAARPGGGLEGAVITGTGFWGPDRVAVRELARLAGLAYSGDLVRGRTTHLVVHAAAEPAARQPAPSGGSSKRHKAAEWGLPCVSLAWLVDSIAAGRALPVEAYPVAGINSSAALGQAPEPTAGPPDRSCPQLPPQRRPSSVASNAPGGTARHEEQQAAADGRPGQQQRLLARPSPLGREQGGHLLRHSAAVPAQEAAAAGRLAEQMRRMSISPELPDSVLGAAPTACSNGASAQQQQQQLLGSPGAPADSAPLLGSPSLAGSSQQSLSMLGLVGAGEASQQAAAADVSSAASKQEAAGGWAGCSGRGRPELQRSLSPEGFSPMQQTPGDGGPEPMSAQQQQQQAGSQQRLWGRQGGGSPDGTSAAGPLPFRLSASRTCTDDLPAGSPMAHSPAVAAALPPASSGGGGTGGSARPPHSRLAGLTPGAESSQEEGDPLCTLPTPACIRNWSEDESEDGSQPGPAGGLPPSNGSSLRRPLAAANVPAAAASPSPQHKQAQQQAWANQQEEQQQVEALGGSLPGAQSDEETVADDEEVLAAADLVVADSQSDAEDCPAGEDGCAAEHGDCLSPQQQRLSPQWQRQQQAGSAQPAAAPVHAAEQVDGRQQAPQAQLRRSGLLRVSRPGDPGQPPRSAARFPAFLAAGRGPPPRQAAAAAAPTAASPLPPPAACGLADEFPASQGPVADEPWDPEQPMSCSKPGREGRGSEDGCAGSSPEQPPQQGGSRPQQAQQGGMQQQGHKQPPVKQKQQARGVRDWSEDDISSSDDEFPTPQGKGKGKRGGLTGLTQLDPASLVIARPRPAGSTATWRSGGDADAGIVSGLKFLQRPPRGNAVRANHGLSSLKGVQFAEQVQVAVGTGLLLSTKDKKTAVRLQPGGLTEEEAEDDDFAEASSSRSSSRLSTGSAAGQHAQQAQQQPAEPVLAEPATFYRLPDGSWWLEFCRFYTTAQAEAAAAGDGQALALPAGFDRSCELLKAVGREHAPMGDVAGAVQVRRVKHGGAALRLRGGVGASSGARSYYWRQALDTAAWRVVTDRPSADFVAVE